MKIKLQVDIELDPAVWDLNYGTGQDREDIADDLKQYVESVLHESIFMGTGSNPIVLVDLA